MHTLRLKLITTTADVQELDTRFRLIWHMHNECVSFAQHRLNELYRDRQYKDAVREYAVCAKEVKAITSRGQRQNHKLSSVEKQRIKELTLRKKVFTDVMNDRVRALRLTKSDFDRFISVMQHHLRRYLPPQMLSPGHS